MLQRALDKSKDHLLKTGLAAEYKRDSMAENTTNELFSRSLTNPQFDPLSENDLAALSYNKDTLSNPKPTEMLDLTGELVLDDIDFSHIGLVYNSELKLLDDKGTINPRFSNFIYNILGHGLETS